MQLQFGTDHDYRAARIVNALAEQVLAEATLLAFQGVGERLQRAVVRAAQHAAAPAVIEQRIHRFLQHALLVADDHVGSMQLHQLLQTIVAVDHAAIQIVEIRSRKTSAIQRDKWTQLGRNDRDHIENHPLRLVSGFTKTLDNAQPLGVLQLLLRRSFRFHALANLEAQRFDIDLLEQLLYTFGAHHGHEGTRKLLIELAFALVADHFPLIEAGSLTRIDDDERFV